MMTFTLFADLSSNVARAEFCEFMQNREPDGILETAAKSNLQRIQFFTDLRALSGKKISHIWKKNGQMIYQQSFSVRGPRWRVWTNVSMEHFVPGDTITVYIQDDTSKIIGQKSIQVTD